MNSTTCLHQILRAPVQCRIAMLPPCRRPSARSFALFAAVLPQARYMSVPRIIQPSFWTSMLPMPFRNKPQQHKSKGWNPATPYIILGLLVGSQAIHILWLKQERGHSVRRAEAKINLLREVIERVQNGEDVPVEALLGAGNEESEREWLEALKEVENESPLFQNKKQKRAEREAAAKEAAKEIQQDEEESVTSISKPVQVESIGQAKFY